MRKYTFDQIEIGLKEQFDFLVSEEHMALFKQITNDTNPLHNDPDYAKNGGFDSVVVYGMLTGAFLSTLAGVYLPGERSLIQSVSIDMLKPVYIGQKLVCEGVVTEKSEAFQTIKVKYRMINEAGVKVLRGSMRIGVREDG